VGRQETKPSHVQHQEAWVVQKTTKGVPPVRIVTKTEWRQQVQDKVITNYTRNIHWGSIVGVVLVSSVISGIFVFIAAACLIAVSKTKLPQFHKSVKNLA
jgi:hypothetical protein